VSNLCVVLASAVHIEIFEVQRNVLVLGIMRCEFERTYVWQ